MADATFEIGSVAACTDGPAGKVVRVVVDPVARTLTHLVVEPDHRLGLGRLVPLELAEASDGAVQLRCTIDELDALPAAEETDFLPGGSGYEDYEAHEAYYWPYYGLDGRPAGSGRRAGQCQRGGGPRHAAGRGDRRAPGRPGARHGRRDREGRRTGRSIRRTAMSPTYCSRKDTWVSKQVAVPAGAIEAIGDSERDGIRVHMTKHEIEALPAVEVTAHR